MNDTIKIVAAGIEVEIPNAWERLTPENFRFLVDKWNRAEQGELSPGIIRLLLLCQLMGWRIEKLRNDGSLETAIALSEQLTFLYRINYGENADLLNSLEPADREQCERVDPWLLNLPLARALRRLKYQYVPDLCFAAQLVPILEPKGNRAYKGYEIQLSHGALTTSLCALQFLEAQEVVNQITSKADNAEATSLLTLLAAILYLPGEYSSEAAHRLSKEFETVDLLTLQCVLMNFQAFCAYLFTRTQFSLLTQIEGRTPAPISTNGLDALYDLSKDGLGDAKKVENINLITYLRLMRKKVIDAVRQMKEMDFDLPKISTETGLPIRIIEKIITH